MFWVYRFGDLRFRVAGLGLIRLRALWLKPFGLNSPEPETLNLKP